MAAKKQADKQVANIDAVDAGRNNGGGDQVALPAGVGTQQDEPAFGPAPVPRKADTETEREEPVEDTKRLRRDKAVWGEGEDVASPNTLLREAQEVDRVAADNSEG